MSILELVPAEAFLIRLPSGLSRRRRNLAATGVPPELFLFFFRLSGGRKRGKSGVPRGVR